MALDSNNYKVCRVAVADDDAFMASTPSAGSLYLRLKNNTLVIGDGSTVGGVAFTTASTLDNYLLKSGGTVSGYLKVDAAMSVCDVISNTTDSSDLKLFGATAADSGAVLRLYGKNAGAHHGCFSLEANDGSGYYQLYGDTYGKLTWDNGTFSSKVITSAGGTFTGFIQTTDAIGKTTDSGFLDLYGGTGNGCGAQFTAFGKDYSGSEGKFCITANNGSASSQLWGSPSGELSWAGYNVITSAGGTINGSLTAGSTNVSGLTTGSIEISSTTPFIDFHFGNSSADYTSRIAEYSSGNLTAHGNFNVTGTLCGAVVRATSDSRLKQNQRKQIYDLSSLSCYKYTLQSDGKDHVGLIAQEVQKLIPEAVEADAQGWLSLDYNSVVAALVSEVNDLKARVAMLEKDYSDEQ